MSIFTYFPTLFGDIRTIFCISSFTVLDRFAIGQFSPGDDLKNKSSVCDGKQRDRILEYPSSRTLICLVLQSELEFEKEVRDS